MTQDDRLRPLLTEWGEKMDKACPLPEHPRPQMRRERWQCLNGVWEYAIRGASEAAPEAFDGEIVVPFSPECVLSGVERQLLPGQKLWYRRTLHLEAAGRQESILLHFGAVDQRCIIRVNGEETGRHEGGYWPFSLDITLYAKAGANTLEVEVEDDSDGGIEAFGKQKLRRGGIWYTAQSGIWQTVWCERVPREHIASLRIAPQWRQGRVSFHLRFSGEHPLPATVTVLDGQRVVAQGTTGDGQLQLAIPDCKSWSPKSPFLYDVKIVAGEDAIASYFGMREFGIAPGKDGRLRLTLNGEALFHSGLLDQGYWSDGMYTPPSDEAMVWELARVKSMGFNMLRKHIKIEPLRWYYHCDRLGLLVWQDFVSGAGPYSPLVTQVLPFVGIRLKDSRYRLFGRQNAAGRQVFTRDMYATVELLYNVVSLAVWVPFNEGWGQFDALDMTRRLRTLDDTRPIDHASGWHDQGGGDFASYHVYYRGFSPKKNTKGRALALTEFGGYSLPSEGHMASGKLFGYKVFHSEKELEQALFSLYEKDVLRHIPAGLAAAVYTQVSDVEDEINGLFTYDRKHAKVDAEKMLEMNERLYAAFLKK